MKKFIILLIVMAVCTIMTCKSPPAEVRPMPEAEVARQPQVGRIYINTAQHTNIDKTLRLVAEQFRKKADVNGDGLTNCIDAAVLFYQYYPDKKEVCIEINYNPLTGMNHLFNCVLTDGAWEAIEPQAYFANHSLYWMSAVWGNSYDKTYNHDETEIWKRYAK